MKAKFFSNIISENANQQKVVSMKIFCLKSIKDFFSECHTRDLWGFIYIYFFFYNLLFLKWSRLKGAIIPPQVHQPLMFRLSSSLNHFEPVSPVQVSDIALKMKCAICKLDVLSLCLFKHVFTTIVSLVEWHLKSAFHFQDFRESCLHTSLLLPK